MFSSTKVFNTTYIHTQKTEVGAYNCSFWTTHHTYLPLHVLSVTTSTNFRISPTVWKDVNFGVYFGGNCFSFKAMTTNENDGSKSGWTSGGVLSIDSFSQSANKISIVYFIDSPTGQMTGRQTMIRRDAICLTKFEWYSKKIAQAVSELCWESDFSNSKYECQTFYSEVR